MAVLSRSTKRGPSSKETSAAAAVVGVAVVVAAIAAVVAGVAADTEIPQLLLG